MSKKELKFVITVDTEADNQWKKKDVLTLENIKFLPRFQKKCEEFGFIPTYLLSYEVAAEKEAVEILKSWQDDGRAEMGAHLHPWTTPPLVEDDLSGVQRFPSQLSDEELSHKLRSLTEIIATNFGQKPASFRAGRYGLDERVVKYLIELGYLVDCSVTPKESWKNNTKRSGGIGGPDFRLAPVSPYFLAEENVCKGGNSKLLEVPLTIIYTGIIKEESLLARYFSQLPESFLKHVLNRLFFRKKQLRIFRSSRAGDWRKIHNAAVKNNLSIMEFMIHSSELMPGGSPYAKNKEEVEFIYKQLDAMFGYFKKMRVGGCGLSKFAEDFSKKEQKKKFGHNCECS